MVVPAGFEFEYQKLCKEAKANDGMIEVTVENLKKMRTLGMNDKFHAMCGDLARVAGDGTKGVKDYIKETAKSIAVEYFGYPQAVDEHNEPLFNKHGRPVGMSTKLATSSEFTMLLEALRTLADQYGYDLEKLHGKK
jgi:hypothetical protein